MIKKIAVFLAILASVGFCSLIIFRLVIGVPDLNTGSNLILLMAADLSIFVVAGVLSLVSLCISLFNKIKEASEGKTQLVLHASKMFVAVASVLLLMTTMLILNVYF